MTDLEGFDDMIRRSLRNSAARAEQHANTPPADEVHQRGRNRRQSRAAALTFAVVAILGGGTVLAAATFGDDGGASPAASTGPSVSTSVTATTPSAPSSTPSTPSTPSTAPEPTSGATQIPEGFTLPGEGATSTDPDFTDWETIEELSTPWPGEVCGTASYAGDALRTDFRAVSASGLEMDATNALAVYGAAETAVGVMADMRATLDGCINDVGSSGFVTSWDSRGLDVGGESFIAVSTSLTPTGESASGGQLFAVVRVGNAIYMTYNFADGFPTLDGDFAAETTAALADFAPRMCVFTVAGC